jgi:hypothetical protein
VALCTPPALAQRATVQRALQYGEEYKRRPEAWKPLVQYFIFAGPQQLTRCVTTQRTHCVDRATDHACPCDALFAGCLCAGRTKGPTNFLHWMLQSLDDIVRNRWQSLSDGDRQSFRYQLLEFVRDVAPHQPQDRVVKTKLAELLVHILKFDFPDKWPAFFTYQPRESPRPSRALC